ncbi:MAG: penicillin-binding protein activator LpoB [Spirochaetes bacterium]|nr:penicillin-binding protein activator LpoB [Candidatus Omnitrophota bacterium]MCK5082576.1 penicillin-binding protein activator LpoB [Candidatus Omnitrophota bacterium]MCK5267867.1 penicillin-binding protein activator LpoB [Spirochaetota bacterium]
MKNFLLLALICVFCSACASTRVTSHSNTILPDQDDGLGGSGIESTDIRTVSRRMAESIIDIPEIANAEGAPRVALLPVKNSTRFIINKDIFTKKIRIELNRNATGKVRFLARERLDAILKEREAKREGLFTSSKEGDLQGVDFYLTGELEGLSKATGGHRSDYILMSFQLIDTETSEIIWEDAYEIKRVGVTGVVYQ